MNLIGLAAVVAALVLLLVSRRAAEYDVAGNPSVRLRPPAAALLPIALLLLLKAVVYRNGEFFPQHPATFYVLLTFGLLLLVCSVVLFSFIVALEPDRIVQRIPLLWQRTLPLSQFVEVQEDAVIPVLVFTGDRKITLLPLYSGVRGFLGHLHAFRAELAATEA